MNRRFVNPFRNTPAGPSVYEQGSPGVESFPSSHQMVFHFENKNVVEEETKHVIPKQKRSPIVFDGETHINKKFKLVKSRKEEAELELEPFPVKDLNNNNDDSFSSREECDLVIDHDYAESENDERAIEEPYLVSRDPRLQRQLMNGFQPFNEMDERSLPCVEPLPIKKERMDRGYSEPAKNLNPFMLEISVEGIKYMAELDTSTVDLQISMEVAEVIQKEVLRNPLRIDHRNGWSNIYPGKIVPVAIDINNFIHVVAGTLRSDINYKIVFGREVLVTFGYNFSVCGLPVKQKA